MTFDKQIWNNRLRELANNWREQLVNWGRAETALAAYSGLATFALFPLVEAVANSVQQGQTALPLSVVVALGGMASDVGGNFIATQLQSWFEEIHQGKKLTEADILAWVQKELAHKTELQAGLQDIFTKLTALPEVIQGMMDQQQELFVQQLRTDIERLGQTRLLVEGSVVLGEVIVGGDFVGRDKITHNYYYGTIPAEPREKLLIYARLLMNQCEYLPLRGVAKDSSDAESGDKPLGLSQVYVDLETTTTVYLTAQEKEDKRWLNQDTRPLTALEGVRQNKKMVLLGDPGGGKSTFVSHVVYCLAGYFINPSGSWLNRLPGWRETKQLPLLIILRDFAQFQPSANLDPTSPLRLWQFIEHRLRNQGISFAGEEIEKRLEKGEMLLLLDGLDEVTTVEQRWAVKQAVEGFMKRYDKNRFVITCRILSYQPPSKRGEKELRFAGLPNLTLARFSPEKIDQFIGGWYEQLALVRGFPNPKQKAEQLKKAVQQPDMLRIAENPLLLTVMALVHGYDGDLPSARALLYSRCVEMLLWRWEQVRSEQTPALRAWLGQAKLAETDLVQMLCEQAYLAHRKGTEGSGVTGIHEYTLLKAIEALNVDLNQANQLIQLMKLRAGLLVEIDMGVFAFPHRTFQEYLTGVYLSNQPDFVEQADRLASENWGLWREVVKLAVGRLIYEVKQSPDTSLALVECLLAEDEMVDPTIYWQKVWLAGELLIEMGVERVSRHKIGQKRVIETRHKVTELVVTGQLEPINRAKVGDVLVLVGDDRPGVLSLTDMQLAFIPAGVFWLGDNDPETKQYQCDLLKEPYWLGRYPVTVAQFKAFMQATRSVDINSRALEDIDNCPVRYVNWYDAMAFCRWLTKQWQEYLPEGYRVTLPNKPEWEKAARGGLEVPHQPNFNTPDQLKNQLMQKVTFKKNDKSQRLYPWGDEPELENQRYRNNCELAGVGKPVVVGAFPLGVSPYGVEEMSGQVLEWTRSFFSRYPYEKLAGYETEDSDNKVPLILCGGVYWSQKNTCTNHFRHSPFYNMGDTGFRVCVTRFSFR